MLNYPLNMNVRLTGPTFIYIDTEGNHIQLPLNNYQAQSVISAWNNEPRGELAEGEAPHLLNPPLGHVVYVAPEANPAVTLGDGQ